MVLAMTILTVMAIATTSHHRVYIALKNFSPFLPFHCKKKRSYLCKLVVAYHLTFANWLLPGAFVSHLVDIPPVPPPHGSAAPSFGQRVRVSGLSIRHWNDSLSVVLVAMAERTLSVAEVCSSGYHTAILRHSAIPFAIADCSGEGKGRERE